MGSLVVISMKLPGETESRELKQYDLLSISVVLHSFEVDVFKENVVLGNDALMKCQVPSLVADLVSVHSWLDSKGNEFGMNAPGNWF